MKACLAFLTLPLGLAAQQSGTGVPQQQPSSAPAVPTKPADLCTLEGQVFNAATGEPVKKASLSLQRADPQPGLMFTPGSGTTTDAAGRFAMKDIEPGKYRLTVQRTGFVQTSYGARRPGRAGTTLTLAPGQAMKEVNFRLIPHGVITGRVVDEDGEPAAYVQVQARSYRYIQGKKQLVPGGNASTNDLGEYRMFGLAPGRYYLSATAGEMGMMTVDRSASQAPEEGYVPTYYPNSTDPASAAPVEVAAGAQLRGLDLTLSRTRTVRIKGRVTMAAGGSPRNVQLMLTPRDGFGFGGPLRPTTMDREGRFELRGVTPGAYTLTAVVFDGERNVGARVPVDVGSSTIENLNVVIQPPMELAGQIRVDGQGQVNFPEVRLSLRPQAFGIMFGPMPMAKVKEDGSFTISNATPDLLNVNLMGLPDGFYVKSVRVGDNEVLESGIDLTRGPAGPIIVTLGPDAGQVEGVVLNAKQQPAQVATVVLIPKDEKRRQRQQNYKTTTTDQYGHYTLKNVDPGEYRLYAWEDVDFGAYMDPDFVKPVEDRGQSISIRSGGHESAQLTLIPAEDTEPAPQSTANR